MSQIQGADAQVLPDRLYSHFKALMGYNVRFKALMHKFSQVGSVGILNAHWLQCHI